MEKMTKAKMMEFLINMQVEEDLKYGTVGLTEANVCELTFTEDDEMLMDDKTQKQVIAIVGLMNDLAEVIDEIKLNS